MEQANKGANGLMMAAGAYILWGVLPIYWKLVGEVPPEQILAQRIVWSFVFMAVVLVLLNKHKAFCTECRQVAAAPEKLLGVAAGALLISINWFVYIWAVNNNRVIETSLGYYINPLFNVLIGILVLREKLSFWQLAAVVLAAIGVLNLVVHFGSVPWVSLTLAISFALYGLCKKVARVSAVTSITLETLLITPVALGYLVYLQAAGSLIGLPLSLTSVLLAGSGIVTAIPLLLFSRSANQLSLTVLGLIQYLSPTIGLMLGIFLYHESFTVVHFLSFTFIWLALLVFSLSKTPLFIQLAMRILKKRYIES